MEQSTIEQLAAALREAEISRKAVGPLTVSNSDISIEDAYAVQMCGVSDRLANGARIVGKKVGLTSRAMQQFLGVDEPDFGHLFDDMIFEEEETVELGQFLQPKVEAEIAFIMGEDLAGPGVTMADVLRTSVAVVPSFEIIASRISDWRIKIQDTIADNGSSAGLVLGGRLVPVDAVNLKYVGMVLEKNGKILETAAGAAVMGHPALAVAWLANKMGAMGTCLRKGEIVLSGSLTKAIEAAPGDVFTATFGGLGSVKVAFA